MKKLCFSCPTVLLRRPIAEIIPRLKNTEIGLYTPKDLIKGFIPIHFNKFRNIKLYDYSIFNPPIVSSEWPIPINPLFLIRLIRILKKYDAVHMWVPFYISNTSLAILKKLFFPKKKLFITMDTFPGLSFKMSKIMDIFFRIYYKKIGRIVFSAADRIVIYGNSMKKFALQAGIPEEKIEIIPTGVNIEIKKKNKDIRCEFGLNTEDKIILFIGLINERKGVDIIIEIARKIQVKNIKFIIVGDGSSRVQYEELVMTYNLNDKVIFTGFRKDVHNFYHEADIFLLPSRGEGLAGVLMESMSYGVPIITSNIVGTRDLIQNDINGFLCECEDIDSYTKKIEDLLNNNVLKQNFITKSKKIINERYNWKHIMKNLRNLYEK